MKTYRFEDGKYEFDRDDNGILRTARRHGAPWPEGFDALAFSKAFHAVLNRIDELEAVALPVSARIDYDELIAAAYSIHKYAQGTRSCVAFKHGAEWLASKLEPATINMVLYCPNCGVQHVDAPSDDAYEGNPPSWTNPPHRSHLCHACSCIWRPADVPTNGVADAKTHGKNDTWVVHAEEVRAQPGDRNDEALLRQAFDTLLYHQEQTRPIHGTQVMLQKLRARLSA